MEQQKEKREKIQFYCENCQDMKEANIERLSLTDNEQVEFVRCPTCKQAKEIGYKKI